MKKIIFTITLVLTTLTLMAQEHLSFKGIPITGTMTEFCQKLKAKGLKSLGYESRTAVFSGDFTEREATIGAVAANDGKNVLGVVVLFNPSNEWNTLEDTYNHYKALYTHKYGEPSLSQENNPAHSDSNTALMGAVHDGRVTYESTWEVAGGEIILSIEKSSGFYEGMVRILYRDSQNVETQMQHNLDEI